MHSRTLIPVLLLVSLLMWTPAAFDLQPVEAAGYERTLLRLHNAERDKRNQSRFRRNGALTRAARTYARVMRSNQHFDHIGPDNSKPHDRMRAAGYKGNATGENIAMGFGSPRAVFQAWMRSPGHRRNIRRASFDRIGFGKSGSYWVTNFGG